MKHRDAASFTALEEAIGYSFHEKGLLSHALTHSSAANERHDPFLSNERLEFLGDSVLSVIVSEHIYRHFPDLPEGELTKLRASLVCEQSLFQFADEISLGSHLFLGKGEELTGGRTRPSILADAFEALLAAMFLDGGMEPVKTLVLRFIVPELEHKKPVAFQDYKTVLQEIIQKNPEELLEYVLASESGPDHDKRFVVEVHLNSNVIGRGEGRSKKQAEQEAAREALELMGQ